MKIILRKKDTSGDKMQMNDKWVTQGNWMVRKDCLDPIRNAELLAGAIDYSKDEAEGYSGFKGFENILKSLPVYGTAKEFSFKGEIRNNYLLDPAFDVVVFRNEDVDKPLGIKRQFVKMFGLLEGHLFGSDDVNPTFLLDDDNESWVIIMPFRI